MADDDNTTLATLGKIGAWLEDNKAIAIPVAAIVLGYGGASLGRRREVRRSYEDGFESGWGAAQRRELGPPAEETEEENDHEEQGR